MVPHRARSGRTTDSTRIWFARSPGLRISMNWPTTTLMVAHDQLKSSLVSITIRVGEGVGFARALVSQYLLRCDDGYHTLLAERLMPRCNAGERALFAWLEIGWDHDLDRLQRGQRNVDTPFPNGERGGRQGGRVLVRQCSGASRWGWDTDREHDRDGQGHEVQKTRGCPAGHPFSSGLTC